MFICWSVKGGSGTTVVSCALALALSRRQPTLLVDLCGDVPAALGLAEPAGPGTADWLASPMGDAAALDRLAVGIGSGLRLVPRGSGRLPEDRLDHLVHVLAGHDGECVIDAGTGSPPSALTAGSVSLLVVRPCYLALRRAVVGGVHADGVVVVREPGRALSAGDVSRAIGAPVLAEIDVDPLVARAVDAGLLAARVPRSLDRAFDGIC